MLLKYALPRSSSSYRFRDSMAETSIFFNTINETNIGDAINALRTKIKIEEEKKPQIITPTTTSTAKTIFKIAVFSSIAFFCFYIEFRHLIILFFLLLIGNGLFINGARKKYEEVTKSEPKEGEVYIGKSFRHYTETYGNITQSVLGIEAGKQNQKAVEVGADGEHYVNYLAEPNPHVLILGSTSSGKTTTMRTFITRVAKDNNTKILLIDWNGESGEWAKKTNTTVWKVPECLNDFPM